MNVRARVNIVAIQPAGVEIGGARVSLNRNSLFALFALQTIDKNSRAAIGETLKRTKAIPRQLSPLPSSCFYYRSRGSSHRFVENERENRTLVKRRSLFSECWLDYRLVNAILPANRISELLFPFHVHQSDFGFPVKHRILCKSSERRGAPNTYLAGSSFAAEPSSRVVSSRISRRDSSLPSH